LLTITQLRKEEDEWHSDTLKALPDQISEYSILWVDAEDPSDAELKELQDYFVLGNLNMQEFEEKGRRSKIEEVEDRISCFASFPSRDSFVSDAKPDWLALIVCKKWILSIHKGHSNITCEIYKKISTHGYSALSLQPSTDILLYIFLDLVVNEYFSVSDLVHERLQNLGSEAARLFRQRTLRSNRAFLLDIAKSREQVLVLRQLIGPMREVAGRITRGEFAVVSASFLPRFEDLYDRTISLIDVVDACREEIHDIGDTLINVQTVTTNNIVRILTIISAIFLPLALIAGIYGTNFGTGSLEPGSNSIYGFYGMIALMAGIAGTLIVVFRRKGWL
jgi:magnesium transporter